ncbi:LysR family transcriptional regulator [Clostridiaceae bacterium UIB06]|uniref:LysR family transcriptional regulator n=1 Tax=Clostridium thailandense TaxID=2794346 RepID=A0A949TXJ4_9CLOT|nr:LysR family transcriptional regulator [Clostridium thailandense]MBV7275396.1 LysR family transcriptional regulator [Clostridium thailandense]MCH5136110.1 LysR family transcriptional regulator [Clostridiaceae bacterium UIB06]
MNTKQLEYFVSLAETLNFTKTAQKFFISQTAVTKQIKKLEQILNTRLFCRNNHHVELTPAGAMFLTQAKAILHQVEEATERVRLTTIGFFGLLRIGFVNGYEKTSFSDLIFYFHNQYPNISITFIRGTEKELYHKVLNSELDIVFNTWNEKEMLPLLEGYLMKTYSLTVVVHPTHPLATRKSLSSKDLTGETIFQYTEFDDVESVLLMVSANMGIAILPFYCVRYLNQSQNLMIIPLKDKDKYVTIAAIWNKENNNSALPRLTQAIKNIDEKKLNLLI